MIMIGIKTITVIMLMIAAFWVLPMGPSLGL